MVQISSNLSIGRFEQIKVNYDSLIIKQIFLDRLLMRCQFDPCLYERLLALFKQLFQFFILAELLISQMGSLSLLKFQLTIVVGQIINFALEFESQFDFIFKYAFDFD